MLGSTNVSQHAERLYEQQTGLPFQYYRAALALIEVKLYLIMRHAHHGHDNSGELYDYHVNSEMVNLCSGQTLCLNQ